MSHVDDGTLHAYLDGELAPVERERVKGHLAACQGCRGRLAEEQAIIERAGRLLDLAAPATSAVAPPLHTLRRRPAWWQLRRPLAWAATVVLAVGLGWFLRGGTVGVSEQPVEARPEAAPVAKSVGQAAAGEPIREPLSAAVPVRPAQVPSTGPEAAADRVVPPASPPPVAAKLAPSRQNEPVAAAVQAGSVESMPTADEEASARSDRARLPSTWTLVDSATASDVLGRVPATIPGRPVRALRRGPGAIPQIAVEQDMGGGVFVVLIEQAAQGPSEGARREQVGRDANQGVVLRGQAQPASERLARFVGPLRVEIAGPLPADSLTQLLELVR
jgi:hypothetical protein